MKRKSIIRIIALCLVALISITGCMGAKSSQKEKTQGNKKTISESTTSKEANKETNKETNKQTKKEANIEVSKEIPEVFKETVKMFNNIRDFKVPYIGGYSLADKQVVVFSMDNEKAIIWNVDASGKTEVVNKSDLPEEKTMSSFADGEFRGKKTIYVMHEGDDKMAFILAVHEGYHFYGQEWLNNIPMDSYIPRGTVYPENIQARYYLNEADARLRDKISGSNKDGHSEALYYYNKLRKEHKDDLDGNLSTALAEGTANFIENMFLAVALNPEIKDDLKLVAKSAYELNKSNLMGTMQEKSAEYYHVASLPLYYTVMMGKEAKLDHITKGIHPLELLSDFTEEKKAEDNKELRDQVNKYYTDIQNGVSKIIQEFNQNMESKEYSEIRVNANLFPGSMQFGDFINFKVDDMYRTLNTDTTAIANLDGNGTIELNEQDTVNSDDYSYFIMYVPKSAIIEKNGVLNIDSKSLSIKNVKFTKKDNAYIID